MGKRNTKQEIISEAQRIEESLLYSSKGHFSSASLWNKFHYILGIPLIISTTLLGTSVFKENINKTVVIFLSLLAPSLTALMTFINPNEKANKHHKAGNLYDALLNKVRRFRVITCNAEKSEKFLAEKVEQFAKEKDKLNLESPPIPFFGYRLAKKSIERGEADYEVDTNR